MTRVAAKVKGRVQKRLVRPPRLFSFEMEAQTKDRRQNQYQNQNPFYCHFKKVQQNYRSN